MSMRGLVATLGVLGLVACPQRKAVAPSAAVAPEVVATPTVGPGVQTTADAPRQVFVVFASQESYVIPVDPTADVLMFPGLVVGAIDGGPVRVRATVPVFTDPAVADAAVPVPYCADADEGLACTRVERFGEAEVQLEASLGPQTTNALMDEDGAACSCISVDGLSDEGRERALAQMFEDDPSLREELEHSDLELEAYIQTCMGGDMDLGTVAVSGGRVYAVGEINGRDCGGANIYSMWADVTMLRGDIPTDSTELIDARCVESTVEGSSVLEFWAALDADACAFGEACCPNAGEATARTIANGVSLLFAGDVGMMGGECGCVQTRPVSPATCASPLDPCGRGDNFDAVDGMAAWWVANDEGAMLGVHDDTFFVYGAGRDDALRAETLGLPLSSIYGVEVLPSFPTDAAEFVPGVLVQIPVAEASPDDSWGNACFRHFKAGRLAQAEAACVEGLLDGGTDKARGALTYTLGRIAQARGNATRAAAFYRRSLRLRPGNATVQARLDALG